MHKAPDISKISKTVQRHSQWESPQDLEGLEIFENPSKGGIGTNSNFRERDGLSKPFVGAFLFVFLDGIAPNQQTSFFLNFSFLFILFTFQLKQENFSLLIQLTF